MRVFCFVIVEWFFFILNTNNKHISEITLSNVTLLTMKHTKIKIIIIIKHYNILFK